MLDKHNAIQRSAVTGTGSDTRVPQQTQSSFTATVNCQLFEDVLARQQQQLREHLRQRLSQEVQQLLDQSHAAVAKILQDDFLLFREQLQETYMQICGTERKPGVSAVESVSPLAGLLDSNAVAKLDAAMEAMEAAEAGKEARTSAKEATTTAAMEAPKEAANVDHEESTKRNNSRRHTKMHWLIEDAVAGAGNQSPLQVKISECMEGAVASTFIGCCVLLNTVAIFLHLQLLGSIADDSLGLNADTGSWRSQEYALKTVEFVFAAIFLAELLLNIYCFGWNHFWNIFKAVDFAIVLLTSVDNFILEPLQVHMTNLSIFRIMILARLARTARAVRVATFFHGFRVIIVVALHSFWALVCSLCVMFIIMLVGTTLLCQLLHDFIVDESADHATRTWVNNMFGSGDRALWTFFEMTFSGCWPNYVRRLVKEVSPLYAVFFALYVPFCIFGLVKLIGALFVRETMQQAARDHDLMISARASKISSLKSDLGHLFEEADVSGDGSISLSELTELVAKPNVQHWFGDLGIDPTDVCLLFELLDNGDGDITKQEFVDGITRIKGEARAQDLVPVMTNCQRILGHCKHMRKSFESLQTSMSTMMAQRHAESLNCSSVVLPSLLPPLSKTEGCPVSRST